jgi:2-amino-1-hydroxyethylphosphonate dioxygenase (glycine-forming)
MTITESTIRQRLDSIFGFYEVHGSDEYVGEPVSILEHSFQSALLAQKEGYDEEVILAAFFHDIGHFLPNKNEMNGLGNINHEVAGANFMYKNGFSKTVALLVRNHVEAKRFLTYKYPDYYNSLSESSKKTLVFQGGKMTELEAKEFEQSPFFVLYLKMRNWDDKAKTTEKYHINLNEIKEMALNHLLENYKIVETKF